MSRNIQTLCCTRTVMKIAAAVAVVCVFFVVIYTTTISTALASFTGRIVPIIQALNESFISHTSPLNTNDFAQALAARADADRYIILVMTDEAFIDMSINFYEVSLRAHQLDNFLFVGLGRNACEMMRNQSIPCFYYADDPNAHTASVYGRREFIRKMNFRSRMIIEALAANFTVIHSDADVVFIHNPVQHIKGVMNHSDLAAMRDQIVYNCGFIVVKPTPVNLRLYSMMQNMTRRHKFMNDQQALNTAVSKLRRQKFQTRATYLNRRLYMDGLLYFQRMKRLLPGTKDSCSSVNKTNCPVHVVHNNWIVSKQAKVYRFREHYMWSYDGKDEYYSSQSRNYIMYTNPEPYNISLHELRNSQLSSLGTALALGYLLDRTVILPRFYCSTNAMPCPLNAYIHIATFDNVFKGKYRESNFLQHAKVPDAVKQNLSHQSLISHASRLSSTSKQYTVDSNIAVNLFRGRKDRLLNFGILAGIKITFSDNSTKHTFNQKAYKAFVASNYRQQRFGENLWEVIIHDI